MLPFLLSRFSRSILRGWRFDRERKRSTKAWYGRSGLRPLVVIARIAERFSMSTFLALPPVTRKGIRRFMTRRTVAHGRVVSRGRSTAVVCPIVI